MFITTTSTLDLCPPVSSQVAGLWNGTGNHPKIIPFSYFSIINVKLNLTPLNFDFQHLYLLKLAEVFLKWKWDLPHLSYHELWIRIWTESCAGLIYGVTGIQMWYFSEFVHFDPGNKYRKMYITIP